MGLTGYASRRIMPGIRSISGLPESPRLHFNEWVYGTEMPSYRFEYQLADGGTTLTGKITQSGVTGNFKMFVPVYVDFGKGWTKIGSATMTGNTSVELKGVKLPQAAKNAAVARRRPGA
jgi:hypothetical protein